MRGERERERERERKNRKTKVHLRASSCFTVHFIDCIGQLQVEIILKTKYNMTQKLFELFISYQKLPDLVLSPTILVSSC